MKESSLWSRARLIAALALVAQVAVHGQSPPTPASHFYLPLLETTDAADLGIALSNPAMAAAAVTLNARSYEGQLITGPGITNPATVSLPALGQRALRPVEIFGSGIAGRTGWIELTPSTAVVKGFFLVFDSGLNFIDGAGFTDKPSSRLIFPKVDAGTTIRFVNTSAQAISHAGLSLYDSDGKLAAQKILAIEAYSGFSGRVSDLLPNMESFSGDAILDTAGTPFSAVQEVLAGLETYRHRSDIAALTAVPPSALLRNGYVAQMVSQGGYATAIGLVNATSSSQRVRITADGLEAGGQALARVSVERTIPAWGRLEETADRLFGFSGNALISGYVRYEVQADGAGLVGYAEYSSVDGLMLSAVVAQDAGLSDIYFSQIAQGDGFYTGIALLNANTQVASVTIDAFDREGRRLASVVERLAAGVRRTRLIDEIFPALTKQSGGYLHITASRPIVAFEVFGSSTSLNVLANVPAHGVLLKPQAAGRPVAASTGAEVLSVDGGISLMVPPGALPADTAISITSAALSSLPNPAANQRVVAAVEGQPSGTTFKVPVRLTFPIAAELPPNTTLPLLLFNFDSKQYTASGFTAVVDDTGRTASAEITHFSTFAAALTDSELLSVTGISPASGLPGTAVTINGTGFNPDASQNTVTFSGADNTAIRAAVTSASANALTVTVPQGAVTGYVIVRSGTRTSIGLLFTVPKDQPQPAIVSLTPSSAAVGAEVTDVSISGTGFTSSSTVTANGLTVPSTFVDPTLLLIALETAKLKPGINRLVVTNPAPGGGASNTVEFTVPYPVPVVTAVTPNRVNLAETNELAITGSGFGERSVILMDGRAVQPLSVTSSILRIPLYSLDAGDHTIAVLNPSPGGGTSNVVTFTVVSMPTVQATTIVLTDPSSGAATNEVVVNEGSSVTVSVTVLDNTAAVTTAFPATFTSLDTAVATVDARGVIQGRRAGFSTLIVSAGNAVGVFTITVVRVNAGTTGITVTGVAQDLAGRLYLAATGDDQILRAEDLTQTPLPYAGVKLTPGLKNDLRLLSWFRNPAFVALNQADGRLFVSDAANHVIRRVFPGVTDAVETFAGSGTRGALNGAGLSASFNNPQGVALDDKGYLWVADTGNHTIRRIQLATRTVETIAGQAGTSGFTDGRGSAARFNSPIGIAIQTETPAQQLDRQRRGDPPPPTRVIVADSKNGAIRRVDESGQVETIATTGTAIRVIDGKSAMRSAATVTFNSPSGVAADPLGNIYVSEPDSGRVKVILQNGQVAAASQTSTFQTPNGIVITKVGTVVVTDRNHAVQQLQYGQPQITRITPNHVGYLGGTSITIDGSNFAPDSIVIAGSTVLPSIVDNTGRIRVTTPSGSSALPSGITTLTVQNRGGLAQTALQVDAIALNQIAPGFITTVAGGSTFIGDGAAATDAALAPWGITLDAAGNLFIVDVKNSRIRRVDARTGTITTVAGNGQAEFGGNGGLALLASLDTPSATAFDRSGNLLIAEFWHGRIRRVDRQSGIINTVIDTSTLDDSGVAIGITTDGFFTPSAMTVDAAGNIFVADSFGNRVFKIDGTTNAVTKLAGTGTRGFSGDGGLATSAVLNAPQGVIADKTGNVFISDYLNQRIRRIDALSGVISTVVGTGSPGSCADGTMASICAVTNPGALSLDQEGNLIFSTYTRVRKLTFSTGAVTTVAGNSDFDISLSGIGRLATLGTLLPGVSAVDAAGNIYVVHSSGYPGARVLRVDGKTGILSIVAGTGSETLLGDGGPATSATTLDPFAIAFDGSGSLFVAHGTGYAARVRRVDNATGVITTAVGCGGIGVCNDPPTDAGILTLNGPYGLAFDRDNNMYVTTGSRVYRVDARTRFTTVVAGNGTGGGLPADGAGDGGPATSASLVAGVLAIDENGGRKYLYIADNHSPWGPDKGSRVRRVDLNTGIITTAAGTGAPGSSGAGGLAVNANLPNVTGLAVDTAGNLFLSFTGDFPIGGIWKVDSAGGITAFVGGGTDTTNVGISRLDVATLPTAITFDQNGRLLFFDAFRQGILRVETNGRVSLLAGGRGDDSRGFGGDNGPATSAKFRGIFGSALAVDRAGNLFIMDNGNNRVRAVRGPIP